MMTTIEESTNNFLDLILVGNPIPSLRLTTRLCKQRTETLEETFAGFIIESKENEQHKSEVYQMEFKALVTGLNTPENVDSFLRQYVNFAGIMKGERQMSALMSILEYGVQNSLLSAK